VTYDIEKDAPERVRYEAEQLHELAVNQFGYHTEHVLFTAHADGTISGRIALYVAGDYHDYEYDNDDHGDPDRDPDPPGVGVTVPRPSTNVNTDTAEAGA